MPGLWGVRRSGRARGGRNRALPMFGAHGAEPEVLGAWLGAFVELLQKLAAEDSVS